MSYDEIVKISLLGDCGVGKSCLIAQYTGSYDPTGLGVGAWVCRTENVMGRRIKLQLADSSGQDRYKTLTIVHGRGSNGVLIIYDITKRSTFNHVANWLEAARTFADGAHIALVGNKLDLEDQREVSFLDASKFAQKNGLLFFECSATKNETVAKMFAAIVNLTQQKPLTAQICYACRAEFNTTTKRPLLLECSHTFCQTCINTQTTQPAPSPARSQSAIICPLCSRKTNYSAALSLPVDYAMQEVVSAAEATKKRTCDMHDGAHEAVHWCFECEQGMCDEALVFHSKGRITKAHQVLHIGMGAPVMRKSATCSTHGKELDLVCTHKSHSPVILCTSCAAVTMHHGHPCVSAAEFFMRKQAELTGLMTRANQVRTKLKTGANLIEEEKDAVAKNRDQTEKLIAAYFTQARKVLTDREKEVLSQLQNTTTDKQKLLQTQQDAVLANIDGIEREVQLLDASLLANAVAKALILMEQLRKRIGVSTADDARPRALAMHHFKSSPFVLPQVELIQKMQPLPSQSSPDNNS